jgi:D-proline reductase (dithiol) PrdB
MSVTGRILAWSFVHAPFVADLWSRTRRGRGAPPFVPIDRPLSRVRLGLVTTGGVHHRDQAPFSRKEESPLGDGSWRRLDLSRPRDDFAITHDWYDHRNAGRDVNLVLPVDRLREFADEGIIGGLHPAAAGLMGHVEGNEERRLEFVTAPEVAAFFRREGVDAVLLVPA